MTDKEAQNLLPLVNNSEAWNALMVYLDQRTQNLKDSLMYVKTLEELKAVQSTVEELRRLKNLREGVTFQLSPESKKGIF